MSDDNAEKAPGALVLLSQAIDLAQAANDDCKRLSALLAASEADLTVERTRADKAEAEIKTQADAAVAEIVRLREVIERVREASEKVFYLKTVHRGFTEEDYSCPLLEATPIKEALAAVPVEPQAEVDTTRERIARNGDMVLRGQGVISDSNGPFRLSLKVDGIWQPVILNTYDWNVEWADQQTPDHENGSR